VRTEALKHKQFHTPVSPPDLEVIQVTTDEAYTSFNVYNVDCPCVTPDSSKLVFCRQKEDTPEAAPTREFWLCHLDDGFAIEPIVRPSGEAWTLGACVSPDGEWIYGIEQAADGLLLQRIGVATRREETVAEAPLAVTHKGVPIVSADGKRAFQLAYFGDGKTRGTWGGYVFDIESGARNELHFGNDCQNAHAQYRKDPANSHDIMFIGGTGVEVPPDGSWSQDKGDGFGGGANVIRDDGTDLRAIPVGRDPQEIHGGHTTWRGDQGTVVTAAYVTPTTAWSSPLIEARPAPVTEQDRWHGKNLPGTWRARITCGLAQEDSCHFAFDARGRHVVSDTDGYCGKGLLSFLWLGTYVDDEPDSPHVRSRYLLLPRSSWKGQPSHPHPFFTPDAQCVCFNSDFPGRPQLHIARGYEFP